MSVRLPPLPGPRSGRRRWLALRAHATRGGARTPRGASSSHAGCLWWRTWCTHILCISWQRELSCTDVHASWWWNAWRWDGEQPSARRPVHGRNVSATRTRANTLLSRQRSPRIQGLVAQRESVRLKIGRSPVRSRASPPLFKERITPT